jgi:pentapeptide MXKDX repeat protein
MRKATFAALCAAMMFAGGAAAQDAMKKDSMAAKPMMSMQECKDYMAMAKADAMKKDAKKDAACADSMKKDGGTMMKHDGMMKGDAMKGDAMAPKK